ncbi:MAG: hypothetical protein ACPIOQ_76195, partial [Promethearchaeia archaeon]
MWPWCDSVNPQEEKSSAAAAATMAVPLRQRGRCAQRAQERCGCEHQGVCANGPALATRPTAWLRRGNKGPVSGDSWANHARQHLSACGYAVPASPARTADGGGSGACVEGISPATRRYGTGAGEGSRGRGWFPRELGSPFPAEDKRGRLSLNLCYSKSSKAVLTLIADALRWTTREASAGPGANASIYWAVAPEEVEEMLIMHKPKQRVGRLPGMHDLCRKVPFARVLDFFAARSPDVYDFHPRSVCLPAQADARCDSLFRHGPAILKPDDGTQGDGIYLVNSKEEALRRMQTAKLESAVLQEYIARPLLIDGYKFD